MSRPYYRMASFLATTFYVTLALIGRAVADQTIVGRDVTVGTPVAMQAFLQESRGPAGTVHLDMWEVLNGAVVQTYDIDMTKIMHMIVISDDLLDFRHVHPTLQPNGHLTIDLHLDKPELYHVYIDGLPHADGRHVFRFDLPTGPLRHAYATSTLPEGRCAWARIL